MLAAGLFGAGAAFAQDAAATGDLTEAQYDELYCVYDQMAVMDDELYFIMIESGISRDVELERSDEAIDAVVDMMDACAAQYEWDEDQVVMATSVGMAAMVGEELEFALLDSGVSDAVFDKIVTVVDGLSDDELDAFLSGEWRENGALQARMTNAMKTAGVPDNPAALSDAVEYLEAGIIGALQTEAWVINETDGG